jgi:mannose/fructose/N-acetylgalactosamine-specific phosphotransferase system component IID
LIAPITVLKNWDYYARENSIATTLAVEWAYQLDPIIQKVYTNQGEQDQVENTIQFAKTATSDQLIPQLQRVISELRLNLVLGKLGNNKSFSKTEWRHQPTI